jgi:hypothetical protein
MPFVRRAVNTGVACDHTRAVILSFSCSTFHLDRSITRGVESRRSSLLQLPEVVMFVRRVLGKLG